MSPMNLSTSGFKAFLIKVLLPFLLLVGCSGYLFNILFEKKIILSSDICGAYKVNRIITETHQDEIPIFGSSRAEEEYLPDMFGSNYFNYGLNGTGANVLLFFLKEECKKRKNSPYLIVNFDLSGFVKPLGDISNYIYNSNCPQVKKLLGNNYKISFSIPFIKYYGQYESYLKYYLNNSVKYNTFTNKGAALEKAEMDPGRFSARITKHFPTAFVQDTALESEFIRVMDENPQRFFVFVVAPYYQPYFKNLKNMPQAEKFLKYLREMKNVRVFDFSKACYADSLFGDALHLNYNGAVIFSGELNDSIKKLSIHNFL
jgi:hypothetical protein